MSYRQIYLDVPFSLKNEVKLAGGKWDMEKKQWYISEKEMISALNVFKIVYLDIPFKEKERAKQAGAKWDMEKKQWYSNTKNIQETCLKNYTGKCRVYYNIPFKEKDAFKEKGGIWNSEEKLWYSYKLFEDYEDYVVEL